MHVTIAAAAAAHNKRQNTKTESCDDERSMPPVCLHLLSMYTFYVIV